MERYIFNLFIAGQDKVNKIAIKSLTSICEKYLKNNYELNIIDIEEHPEIADKKKIIAIPTLIKELPDPVQKIIGDLSDIKNLEIELGLENL
ncbi:KaiB domain protein [Candidatus Magnetomorum sp. HK-1]|nr:KaiB domain protein [Candidatus Magnetomorum sp. HK-1]